MNKNIALLASALLLASMATAVLAGSGDDMAYARLSCNELYTLASRLEPETQHFRSPIFNTRTNVILTAIGSVADIGYYYFGVSTLRDYYEDYRVQQHGRELDRIRRYMAQQYCFQKF